MHFIHEKVTNNDVCLKVISSVDQVPNSFTKDLTATCFTFLKRTKLMLCSPLFA